jgi:hypothetical protein
VSSNRTKREIEARFVTKAARDAEDAAIEKLPVTATMAEYLDTWLAAYRQAGGIER